jgi:hypothetical protein
VTWYLVLEGGRNTVRLPSFDIGHVLWRSSEWLWFSLSKVQDLESGMVVL